VYEAAKDMGMSSEALVSILKSLQVDVKSHMSSIGEEVVEQVRLKISREKEAVKEEEARKREKAVQAAKAAAEAQRRTAPAGSLAGAKNAKILKKKKRAVDEKLIRASVRRTMAEMEGTKRRRHHREREEGAAVGVGDVDGVIEHRSENGVERKLRVQERCGFEKQIQLAQAAGG